MVGAGFSLNAEPLPGVTKGFPTWRQLVRVMFDELHPSAPNETAEEARDREARFNGANALRLASEYEAAFDRRKLDLLIHSQNPDLDHQPGKIHQLLLHLPWTDVFTTNYDTLLERTEIPGRTYQPVTKASELTTAFAPRIVKLHGSFPSQTPFIISEEDYRTYPRKFAPFVNSVRQSLLENAFVLLGFSGDDPNFLEWTGWIRDELGGNHAPIYLVGPLSLGNAERSLLGRRGVTTIDLSPVFAGIPCPKGVHSPSIEWFLNSLSAAQPPRPEEWPESGPNEGGQKSNPPILSSPLVAPAPAERHPDIRGPLTNDTVAKLIIRWQHERLNYPGWIVLSEERRSGLWERTKYWIAPLTKFSESWSSVDRILLFREINWRLETAMVPLFTGWIETFQKAMNDLSESLVSRSSVTPLFDSFKNASDSEITDAWLEVAFGLLREARETYNGNRWNSLKTTINNVVERYSKQTDRNYYEAALWEVWNVQHQSARGILSQWQPSPRSPLAVMWKAGLLAEMDELHEARTSLRAALLEIRRALRTQGQNIELLSLEGWCTYLLFSVETSSNVVSIGKVRDEFWQRWQELKAWDCSPWPHKEYFKEVLSAQPPKPHQQERLVRDFDPGQVTLSRHWTSDHIGPFLPAFACIRLFEQVGIPTRLPMFNISGDVLKNACLWVFPFINFWSPALLIRAGKIRDLTDGGFLNRTQVAAMDQAIAKRLYLWFLQIMERELASLGEGVLTHSSMQEALLEVLPEMLSRLAFKMEAPDLRRAFSLALEFYKHRAIRSHIGLHDSCEPWFRRLFEAADDGLLLEWLPLLIKAPLLDDAVNPVIPVGQVWPDPMRHFPAERGRIAKDTRPDLLPMIQEATDWLLRRGESETGEARRRVLDRLMHVYHAELMAEEQQSHFGSVLWGQRAANGLPDLPNFAVFGFLHLPAPKNINVPLTIKNHIMTLTSKGVVSRNLQGQVVISSRPHVQPLIEAAASASKPLVQLAGEEMGRIEWTPAESKQLYLKAREWWNNDKEAVAIDKRNVGLGLVGTSEAVLYTLKELSQFLARAVIPQMEFDGKEWQELLAWLEEVKQAGVFTTLTLPYLLLRHPDQAKMAEQTITNDLNSDTDKAVAAAAKATRHWINLAACKHTPAPSPNLLSVLIERVVFRRKINIAACLWELCQLIVEKPEAFTPPQASLLVASLGPWHEATRLPIKDDFGTEFHEEERPDLRVLIASLAAGLRRWHTQFLPQEPEPAAIGLWRNLCTNDPLPEIRRAFQVWDHVKT